MNTTSETPTPKPARRPLSDFILTAAQLAQMTPEEVRRIRGTHRRPVWRYWYDPYAGPPVAQTVAEALANAAKAPPGTIPEVEMLTPDEVEQREQEIRNRPAPTPSPRKR